MDLRGRHLINALVPEEGGLYERQQAVINELEQVLHRTHLEPCASVQEPIKGTLEGTGVSVEGVEHGGPPLVLGAAAVKGTKDRCPHRSFVL
jgi:hypothetical protein